MTLDTTFRLSFYVTLALACICLAQAEVYFLQWFPALCLPLAVLVLVLAWRFEGRWVLHENAANYLGIFIGLATGGWVLAQLPRSEADLVATGVPWPAGLLPPLGPVLLVLLAVKLFRPKRLSDFWVFQTIGLMLVTLGCVLAGDPTFAALLLVYLAALVWCLALFHVYRSRRPAPGPLFQPGEAPAAGAPLPWRLLGAGRAARWSAAVLPAGLALFMLLPRTGDSQWVPQKLSSTANLPLSVGLETGINLNRVGTVELSPEPAFHVVATDAAGAPARLDDEQRWQVDVLDFYVRGHWLTWSQAQEFYRDGALPRTVVPAEVPDQPGPGELLYRFEVNPSRAGGLVLAEPVDVRRAGLDARVNDARPRLNLFHAVPGGDSVIPFMLRRKGTYFYAQVCRPERGADWSPAVAFDPSYRDYLLSQPAPEDVTVWARDRLGQLAVLSDAERAVDAEGRIAAEHHAAVSRALCRYFAFSGDFRYTLNLRRHDRSLDPTADFLCNVKEGHCERYAAALALSLRSLGVPARVVKGYRGAEEEGEGRYVVRLDQAHSWVQVLTRDGDRWGWLTLDPTPGVGEAANPLANWLGWLTSLDAEQLWRRFVLNYNGEAQANAAHYLWQGLWQSPTARHLLWQVPLGAGALLSVVGAWRGRARLRQLLRPLGPATARAARPAFYARLLRALARRCGLSPQPGQTPLEFAAVAGAALARDPATAAWSTLPADAARALYRARYSGQPLTAAEDGALGQRVADLELALTGRRS